MAKEQRELLEEGTGIKGIKGVIETEPSDASIMWGKVVVTKLTVLDKIVEGLKGGANIDHCLTLSNIYRNLCN